jgi:hypothetical protein
VVLFLLVALFSRLGRRQRVELRRLLQMLNFFVGLALLTAMTASVAAIAGELRFYTERRCSEAVRRSGYSREHRATSSPAFHKRKDRRSS